MRRMIASLAAMGLLVGILGCGGHPDSQSQTAEQKTKIAQESMKLANPFPSGAPNPAKTGGDLSGKKK